MQSQNLIYIDDRIEDIEMVRRIIKKEFPDVNLISLNDSEEALEIIKNNTLENYLPKLILIDIKMPKVSGFDILEAMMNKEQYKKLPKVIFSSSKQPGDIETAYNLDCSSYLEKPSTYGELKEKIITTVNYWLKYNLNT